MGACPFFDETLISVYGTTLKAFFVILLSVMTSCLRRGPHHPAGQGVGHKHHHYVPRGTDKLTEESNLLHDAKHIEEDVKVLTPDMVANMTPEELEFHYFSAHDFDRNSMLDGLEMLKAVYHTMDHEHQGEQTIEPESVTLATYIDIVDRTLESDDTDGDGFVSYAEYRAARITNPEETLPPAVVKAHVL